MKLGRYAHTPKTFCQRYLVFLFFIFLFFSVLQCSRIHAYINVLIWKLASTLNPCTNKEVNILGKLPIQRKFGQKLTARLFPSLIKFNVILGTPSTIILGRNSGSGLHPFSHRSTSLAFSHSLVSNPHSPEASLATPLAGDPAPPRRPPQLQLAGQPCPASFSMVDSPTPATSSRL
jgi:hypothetical protein